MDCGEDVDGVRALERCAMRRFDCRESKLMLWEKMRDGHLKSHFFRQEQSGIEVSVPSFPRKLAIARPGEPQFQLGGNFAGLIKQRCSP